MNSTTTNTLLLVALTVATILASSGCVVNALTASSPQQGFRSLQLRSRVYYYEENDEWIPEDEEKNEQDDDELDYYNNDEYWTPEQIEQMENLYEEYREVIVAKFGEDWEEETELEEMEIIYEGYLEFQEQKETEHAQAQAQRSRSTRRATKNIFHY